MAIESVKGYGFSEKYIQRQTFVKMLHNLHQLPSFSKCFSEVISNLTKDPIIVVRITLAETVARILE